MPALRPALLVLIASLAAAVAADDPIVGEWLTGDGSARVRIVADGAAFAGSIVWLKEPNGDDGKPQLDVHNPEEAHRVDPVLNLRIVRGLRRDGGRHYEDGTVYDPKSGKTYRCKATLSDDGAKLDLRGFVGLSLFGRTETWKRVAPAP